MNLNSNPRNSSWRLKHAFTLLETLVMMAALFVVTMLVAGIVKVQRPEWFGVQTPAVQAATPVGP